MKPIPDLHVHSVFSDGVELPSSILKRASEKNLSNIGISDHFDELLECSTVNRYIHRLFMIRHENPLLLLSVESDVKDAEEFFRIFQSYPVFDYIIFHDIKSISDINVIAKFSKKLDIPIVLGHLYIREIGGPNAVLNALKNTSLIPEVNSQHFIYLKGDFLREEINFYQEIIHQDKPLSFGSDAHTLEAIGEFSDEIKDLYKAAKLFHLSDDITQRHEKFFESVSLLEKEDPPFFTENSNLHYEDSILTHSAIDVKKALDLLNESKRTIDSNASLLGEKRLGLSIIEKVFSNNLSLRQKSFSLLENYTVSEVKHVRKWSMDSMANIYGPDLEMNNKIMVCLSELSRSKRQSTARFAQRALSRISTKIN